MGVTTSARAITATTMCEAFQMSAARFPDVVALRVRGDTVGLMLTNMPEFHWCDSGAMHLGATAFSIYNTSAPEQIEYLLGDAQNSVLFTEKQFVERIEAAEVPGLEHVIVIDDGGLAELMAAGDDGFDLEASWRAI